jgi:hypothetical protein
MKPTQTSGRVAAYVVLAMVLIPVLLLWFKAVRFVFEWAVR